MARYSPRQSRVQGMRPSFGIVNLTNWTQNLRVWHHQIAQNGLAVNRLRAKLFGPLAVKRCAHDMVLEREVPLDHSEDRQKR